MTNARKAASNAEVESAAAIAAMKLLPCPYCGEADELYPAYRLDKDGKPIMPPYAIDCIGCGHDFTPRPGVDARVAWNRRAPQAQGDGEERRGNFIAVTSKQPQMANWHTAIYEDDYKGLLIALCNQNGRYPWQVQALLDGLNGKKQAADEIQRLTDLLSDCRAALAPKEGAPAADMGRSAIDIAMAGYQKWAEKPHNAKWVRKIDGTPIPNDLPVCIANEFAALAPVQSSSEPSREPEAYLIENVMVPTAPFAPRDTTLTDRDWLYPARRAEDAHEAAKMLRGDLIPLYRSKGAAPFLPAQAEPVAVKALVEVSKRLRWIADARWDEDADLDTLCTHADQALAALSSQPSERGSVHPDDDAVARFVIHQRGETIAPAPHSLRDAYAIGKKVAALPVEEHGWRDIESAPKQTGARFLVWVTDAYNDDGTRGKHAFANRSAGGDIVVEGYSHGYSLGGWMPLPTPPQGKEGGAR